MLDIESKKDIAKTIEAKRLLELYDNYKADFDPLNSDTCETFDVIKAEIISRMEKGA